MPESVDPRHLLLIGAGPGVGASVVRRFGREGFRSTLISRGGTLAQLAPELRNDGLEIDAVGADIEDLDGYRATLERIFCAPGAPGVAVYNAALPDPGEIIDTTADGCGPRMTSMSWAQSSRHRSPHPSCGPPAPARCSSPAAASLTIRYPDWRACRWGRPRCARRRP